MPSFISTSTTPAVITTTANGTNVHPSYLVIPWYVAGIKAFSNTLSLVGAILIFMTYFRFPRQERTFLRKLLLYLTIANCVEVFGNYIDVFRYLQINHDSGEQPTDAMCFLQSFTTSFAPAAGYLWTSVIAVFFHARLLNPEYERPLSCFCAEILYHVVCWSVPAVVVILAVYYNVFGEDFVIYGDTGCWIRSDIPRGDVVKWMILTNKVWELVSLIIISESVIYVLFQKKIVPRLVRGGYYAEDLTVQADIEARAQRLRSKDRNFLYIWMVVFLVRFSGHVRFIIIAVNPEYELPETGNIVLMCLQAFGDSAQAFGNFVVLCLCDASARRRLCSCCGERGDVQLNVNADDDAVEDDDDDDDDENDYAGDAAGGAAENVGYVGDRYRAR